MNERSFCEACDSNDIRFYKVGTSTINTESLSPELVQVTNKTYGVSIETVKCNDCSLVQPKYILSNANIVALYLNMTDRDYLKDAHIRCKSSFSQINNILKPIETSQRSEMCVFEIGCGGGHLLREIRSTWNAKVSGLEPSKHLADVARDALKLDVTNCGFEELNSHKKYDLIIALDVIEHVASPNQLCSFIYNHLKKDGVAVIATPDTFSITHKVLGKRWWHVRPPHIYYFNNQSMTKILSKNNLRLKKSSYFYWSFPLSYILQLLQQFFLKKVLFKFSWLGLKVNLNTYDSKIYLIEKVN